MEEGYPFEDIEDEEIQYYSRICEEKMNIETEIHFIPVYNEWLEFVESGQASQVSAAEYKRRKKDIQYKAWLLGMRFPKQL
jgi:hypothetical protein